MQIIFEFRVNIHRLSIHLGNDPSVLQQFVDSDKILIVVDIILLCKITAVADVNDLLHCFTPFTHLFTITCCKWAICCFDGTIKMPKVQYTGDIKYIRRRFNTDAFLIWSR